jgi:LmbE family N-acetylglucosaminyl deacetylase
MSHRSALLFALLGAATLADAQNPLPPFTSHDRIVIIAPHPDDEVLACAGVIQQAGAAGADVRVIYLTNGDHNQIAFKLYSGAIFLTGRGYQRFGEKRRSEAVAATGRLGLTSDHLTFLGYPDWGLQQMWRDYWEDTKAFRSDATRVSAVPYKNNYSYQKPYRPEALYSDLKTLLATFRPTTVFAPHPAEANADHRAVANFTHLALLELAPRGITPQVLHYVIHFGDWPKPYHYHPDAQLTAPTRLRDDGEWFSLPLTRQQTETKHLAILDNATQLTTRQFYLVAFARANELFSTLPRERVIHLPDDASTDWRQAVRQRAIRTDTASIPWTETTLLRQGDHLIAAVDFDNRLGPRSNAHLFLYGCQRGADFATLPKVHINVNPLGNVHVYDDDRRRVPDHGVTRLATIADKLVLRVPLRLLGGSDLDHLFTATRATFGTSHDDTAWRLYQFHD